MSSKQSLPQIADNLTEEQSALLRLLPLNWGWLEVPRSAVTAWAEKEDLIEWESLHPAGGEKTARLTVRGMALRAWMCGRNHYWGDVPMVPCLWPLGYGSVMAETRLGRAASAEDGLLMGILRMRGVPDAHAGQGKEGEDAPEHAWTDAESGPELMLTFRTPESARRQAELLLQLAESWEQQEALGSALHEILGKGD